MNSGPIVPAPHTISVVIPVYQGEQTLPALIEEIHPLTDLRITPGGHGYLVEEVLLVHDNGPDQSDVVMRELEARHPFVRAIWLSKNFGQHAATMAGMASSGADWIITLDEDGQHDPADIGVLLDAAMSTQAGVVYAKPTNPAPHGFIRNSASKTAKWLLKTVSGTRQASDFQSYRLMLGSVGRSVAAYAGSGVYLDIALGWVAGNITTAPVELREEGGRRSGYSPRRLVAHFVRMVLSSGTRVLRIVALLGILFALLGLVLAVVVLLQRLFGDVAIEGWASTMIVILGGFGVVLFSIGVVAEYIGTNVDMAMGKPRYLITSDPKDGPLGRPAQH